MLIPVIYITIHKDSITLLNAKNGKSTIVTGNFSNERLAIANFTEAADAIKKGLFEVYPKSLFRVFPYAVVHQRYLSEGGLCESEEKLLKALAPVVAVRHVHIWSGDKLSLDDLKKGIHKGK
jgi:rod shape-determining protein MreB